ncbi:MAG: N-6 DNA methylase [Planctomycetia bacterium]|nr:N-6 DNA methylase [Planctomycetia bacterium]
MKKNRIPVQKRNRSLSADPVCDEFFNQYREFYRKFVEYGTGKKIIKQKGKWIEIICGSSRPEMMDPFLQFNDPEKAFRDCIKKMLVHLLLQQFLQKKDPLPVSFSDGFPFEKNDLNIRSIPFPKEYFEDLFRLFGRFAFTLDENDPKNTISPEMLGRVYENLLEDNRTKGAFYTPKEIVRFMCRESLIVYLGDTPRIRALFADPPDIANIGDEKKKELLQKLREVKICDPAVGSGAFSMEMLHLLLRTRNALGEFDKDDKKTIAKIKKEIIENNIYGVDIDSGAADIARLRFWLSLIADEETPTPFFDLDSKIIQGNCLLEQYKGTDQKFDIVIGNPPYIDAETMSRIMPEQRVLLRKLYPNLTGNWDLYMAFWELAAVLSKNIFLYITPNKWLSKPFGKNFRKNFARTKLRSITFCGSGLFETASVDAVVSLFCQTNQITAFGKFDFSGKEKIITECSLENLAPPWYMDCFFSEHYPIIEKIQRGCVKKLKEIALCENACSTHDAYVLEPLIENKENFVSGRYCKLVNTGTIEKFQSRWGKQEITYLKRKILYPVADRTVFSEHLGRSFRRRISLPKIIIKGLNLLDVFPDLNGEYIPGKTTLCICSENLDDLKLLCAILNSDLLFFYIREVAFSSSYCGGIAFTPEKINDVHLPEIPVKEKNDLIRFTDEIIAHRLDVKEGLERINKIVFSLYGLNAEEADTIRAALSKRTGNKRSSSRKSSEKQKGQD